MAYPNFVYAVYYEDFYSWNLESLPSDNLHIFAVFPTSASA